MTNYQTPTDINKEAVSYMEAVVKRLNESSVLEEIDFAALNMLANNYSMFITASKQLEDEGFLG